MRRWPNEDQLERYYSRLERYAKPLRKEDFHPEWDERIEQLRLQFGEVEEYKDFFENAHSLLESTRAVGIPLFEIDTWIDKVRTLNEPWDDVILYRRNCPLLSVDQIFKCLFCLCDENISLILHSFEHLSYDSRFQIINALHQNRKRRFSKLIKESLSTNDLVLLSDICWNNKLTNATGLGDGYHWHFEFSRSTVKDLNKADSVKTVDDFMTFFGAVGATYYNVWQDLHRKPFTKERYTDREKSILIDIISRPEAAVLEQSRINIEKKWQEYQEKKNGASKEQLSAERESKEASNITIEMPVEVFSLPESFFYPASEYPIDQKNPNAHFIPDFDIQKHGGSKFAELINTISSFGYIAPSTRNKQLLTYVLTGRCKPNDYQEGEKVEWIDSGYGYELLYVIKYIIGNEKGKFEKARNLFNGPQWLGKGDFKDQADYAKADFRKALHAIYPDECKVKGHVDKV